MTGAELQTLRRALGIELPWFASLLGLHVAKLEHWESLEGNAPLHPLQTQIVTILELQVRKLGPHAASLGRRILIGLMRYGPPYGLLIILQGHFAHIPEFTPTRYSEPPASDEPV